MSSLKNIVEGKSVLVIEATVVQQLEHGKAIIAEKGESAALLITTNDDQSKKLFKSGRGIKIIKPELIQKEPIVFKTNDKFKLIASKGGNFQVPENIKNNFVVIAENFGTLTQIISRLTQWEPDKQGLETRKRSVDVTKVDILRLAKRAGIS